MPSHDPDYARDFSVEQIARGVHRSRVGGLWDTMGSLQLDFLSERGLYRSDRLLDVACGALRAGIHFVDFLEPGHYFGIDINQSLLDAGYDLELTDYLREKLPRDNLRRVDRFDCDFGVQFDVAIAQSLFTHVPLNHVRLCMYRVAQQMRPGGRFYLTFNEKPKSFPVDGVVEGGKYSFYGERNVYWYYRSDLRWAASFSPWKWRYIGDWGHPRKQRMVELTRIPDDQWQGPQQRSNGAATKGSRRRAPRLRLREPRSARA